MEEPQSFLLLLATIASVMNGPTAENLQPLVAG